MKISVSTRTLQAALGRLRDFGEVGTSLGFVADGHSGQGVLRVVAPLGGDAPVAAWQIGLHARTFGQVGFSLAGDQVERLAEQLDDYRNDSAALELERGCLRLGMERYECGYPQVGPALLGPSKPALASRRALAGVIWNLGRPDELALSSDGEDLTVCRGDDPSRNESIQCRGPAFGPVEVVGELLLAVLSRSEREGVEMARLEHRDGALLVSPASPLPFESDVAAIGTLS